MGPNTLTPIHRGEGAPSALLCPGDATWRDWSGRPTRAVFSLAPPAPAPAARPTVLHSLSLRLGPVVLHRLSLVGPQVRTRAPPPGDAAASCCAFLLFIWRRLSRVSERGDAGMSLALLRSRIPPTVSAHLVRRPAGPAGASVLEVCSGGPSDRSISSEFSMAAVSSAPSTPQVVCRSVRFYET